MDFFSLFSALVAGGFLVAGFLRQRIGDPGRYRTGLALLLAALILYYPVSEIFGVGMYLSLAARPVGFVLEVVSFRLLCLALARPREPDSNPH